MVIENILSLTIKNFMSLKSSQIISKVIKVEANKLHNIKIRVSEINMRIYKERGKNIIHRILT